MLCALIMAGGKGTRFWPLSTDEKPKQFLNLVGEQTMIQMTVNRIKSVIPIERIFVSTGEQYVHLVKLQLPELPERNIIIEPEGRNTAPCIALSALIIKRYYSNSTMLVLPSDHLIKKENVFIDIIKASREFLNDNENAILTLGIKPNRPESAYGYIRCGKEVCNIDNYNILKVETFVEKPNRKTAEKYLKQGNYLWNGGMFMWKIDNIINKIKQYSIDTYEALKEVDTVEEKYLQSLINEKYNCTQATSIDYAVLEKSNDIYVVPTDIGWDDIGLWESIERYRESDENGNITIGCVTSLNANDNLIVSQNNKVIISGLDGIFVIENEGNIVIGKREEINNIKQIKELI